MMYYLWLCALMRENEKIWCGDNHRNISEPYNRYTTDWMDKAWAISYKTRISAPQTNWIEVAQRWWGDR